MTVQDALGAGIRGSRHTAGGSGAGGASLGDRFQRAIITIHRWMGVLACLFFVSWFISGIVLVYVHFPKMTVEERLGELRPMAWETVKVSPQAALSRAGLTAFPQELRLEMSGATPVYRIVDWHGGHHTVSGVHQTISAVTGQPIEAVTAAQALDIVRRQLLTPGATLERANFDFDQWTCTSYWNAERPFHLVSLNDARGTQIYVSVQTGEIVLKTTKSQRLWNWVGAIPHWIYFESIRWHEGAWVWVIYVLAGCGIFVAGSGLWVGFTRLKLRSRYANGKRIPFTGWMRWHHLLGIFGGVFLALWIVSGLFTMYPGGFLETRDITKTEHLSFGGEPSAAFPAGWLREVSAAAPSSRRATFRWLGGEPLVVLEDGISKPITVDGATGHPLSLSNAQIVNAARAILPSAHITSSTLLRDGDEYWHSGFYKKRLPALRVVFDDPSGSWFHFDPTTGEMLGLVDKTSRIDRWSVVAIHDLDWYWLLKQRPWWDVFMLSVTVPGLLISFTALIIGYRRLQRSNLVPTTGAMDVVIDRLRRPESGPPTAAASSVRSDVVVVAYASQTGTAKMLAERTSASLENAGLHVALRDLGQVDVSLMAGVERALFIVATSGDGDPPDHVMAFERKVLRKPANLRGLRYRVLALGDMQYSGFCKFGNTIDSWLHACGATRLGPTVLVDDLDPIALEEWSSAVGSITGRSEQFEVQRAPYEPWRIVVQRHLNPGSAGAPVYHLELEPEGPSRVWEAGDIAQVLPASWTDYVADAADSRLREFSIASTVRDGRLHLLIRQMRSQDGTLGLASALFTDGDAVGRVFPLRIRANPGFHPPSDDRRMVLIGNGTGLAGLRSHLRRRVQLGHTRNWLIFGERNRACDAYYEAELQNWLDAGQIERIDLVFSRDRAERRYVQHQIRDCAGALREWVRSGASVYVCGSLQGMAPAVNEALVEVLGQAEFDELIASGRYLRDVY